MSSDGPATFVNLRNNALYIQVQDLQSQYTSGDRIEGVVRVDPTVRPRNVAIVFTGFSLLHDKDAVPSKPKFFEFSEDLFVSTGAGENFDILRQGTASDGKVELPFSFTFPYQATLPPPSDRTWWYPRDNYNHPRFQHSPGFLLPPSCSPVTSAINGLLAPKVVYHLEARVDSTLKVRQDLIFLPPAPNYDLALLEPNLNFGPTLPKHYCGYKLIRTRKLLPGYSESSRLAKLRDILVEKELFFGIESYAEVPYVKFHIFEVPARVLVIGGLVPIIVMIQHLERSDSLPDPPVLYLRRVRVLLNSACHTFISVLPNAKRDVTDSVDVTRETITLLDKKFDKSNEQPLHNALNLLNLETIRVPRDNLVPSFTSYGMTMEYELQVDIWGECADREFAGITCKEPVQLVTDWPAHKGNETADDADDQPLTPGPAYEEVDPLAAHEPAAYATHPPGPASQHDTHSLPAAPPHQSPHALPPPPYIAGGRWA